jgi:uncharacterized membrane protein
VRKKNDIKQFNEIKRNQICRAAKFMTECTSPTKKRRDSLAMAILIIFVVSAAFSFYISLTNPEFGTVFLPASEEPYRAGGVVYEAIFVLLTIATDALYVLGGAVVAFGGTLLAVRFVQCKVREPYKPSCVSRYLSGYLTLSLEFFIGAEIIKTVIVRTFDEFLVLILVIFSRGLFSLILYLDRRWHGSAETE